MHFDAHPMPSFTYFWIGMYLFGTTPYDMWLEGRDDIFEWWYGPGIGCKGSRVIPTVSANGSPAFGQYKPSADGGYEPWALQVLELEAGRIVEFTFFLDTEALFPLFGLPLEFDG